MIQLLIIVVFPHILHGDELLNPGHDGFYLAREPGEADDFLEEVILPQSLSSFHYLYDSRIDAVLSVLQNLVVDGLGVLPSLFLLDCVDLDSSEFGSKVQVYLELVFVSYVLFDRFGFLLHKRWNLLL